jgi:hypothetical protein
MISARLCLGSRPPAEVLLRRLASARLRLEEAFPEAAKIQRWAVALLGKARRVAALLPREPSAWLFLKQSLPPATLSRWLASARLPLGSPLPTATLSRREPSAWLLG